MKAFVTGCSGFIGSHLVDSLLKENYEVIGIDCFTDYYSRYFKESNISNALKNVDFTFIEDDILNLKEFPDVDHVFHLAAQPGVRSSWGKNFEIYTRNNVEVTQRLLEYYKNRNIKKIIYSSSSSVYGDTTLPMNEASVLRPVSPYGVTKLAAEHLCYLYHKNFGVPTVSLRYFTVFGPRQRPDMAIHKFVKAIISDEYITVFGDGTQTRDFTFVKDIVSANILAAKSSIVGEVFNIGGGSRISVRDLIQKIEEISGKNAKIRFVEKEKGDVRDTLADVSKARNMLDFKAKTDVNKGLAAFMDWWEQVMVSQCDVRTQH